MENTWAEVGKDCVCVRERWLKWDKHEERLGGFMLIGYSVTENPNAPKFMQTYKIVPISTIDEEDEGHRVKLHFNEFPGEHWCACGFRPLEKIEDEEHKDTTAPVDRELV